VISRPKFWIDENRAKEAEKRGIGIYMGNGPKPVPEGEEPNVYVSLVSPGMHAPCIDIDLPCRLIESKTPGHFHLYIDTVIPEDKYFPMLKAMADAKIVQSGYYHASVKHGMTVVRIQFKDKIKSIIERYRQTGDALADDLDEDTNAFCSDLPKKERQNEPLDNF